MGKRADTGRESEAAATPAQHGGHLPELVDKLKAYNQNLENALDASSLVSVTDAEGMILYANRLFCEVSQYTRDELLGQNHRIINSGFHSTEFMRNLWATILAGKIWHGEICNRKKDGTLYWVQSTIIPFLNSSGKPYQFYAIRQEITRLKQAEVNLVRSREALLQAQAMAHLGTWEWSPVDDSPVWSEEMFRIFGLPAEGPAANFQEVPNYYTPDSWATLSAAVGKTYETGEPYELECEIIRTDQSRGWVICKGIAVRDAGNKITGLRGTVQDITERRRAELQVREQAALLDQAQDAILVRDLDHKIQYWNKGAERIYGWSGDEVAGKSARDLLYEDPLPFDEAIHTLLARGEYNGELQQKSKAGKKLIVQVRWTLLRDERGRAKSILAINSDITERKKLEQQFLRAQRLESIGTLAGGIAHDLNNVLTPILLALEILKMGPLTADQLEMVSTMELSAKRGAGMVKQVLSFARGAEGNRAPMRVETLIADIEKIIRDTFPKNITVRVHLPANLWMVQGDVTQLHQVLVNLAVNSRDALPDGGEISLSAENCVFDAQYAGMHREMEAGNYVAIGLEDTGQGMNPETLEKIFEPFFTTKEQGKGTGLGLSTSLAIVKGHGGFMRAYSEPGKGTRFHVYLPALLEAQNGKVLESTVSLPRGKGETILVVDDEDAVRSVTRQTLEAFGYTVKTAADGAEAVSVFAQEKDAIDLVLTDMMMPVLDGMGTIQVIRKIKPKVPIVAASGLDAHAKVARLSSENVRHFLPKPYTADLLLKTVRQALDEEN